MYSGHKSSITGFLRRYLGDAKLESNENAEGIQRTITAPSRTNETTYVRMLREEAEMELRYNLTVSVANWALLAGYLVIPGTFTSLQKSSQVQETLGKNSAGRAVMHTIQNPPLLGIACLFLVGAISALVILLYRSPKPRGNYPWLINKLFT